MTLFPQLTNYSFFTKAMESNYEASSTYPSSQPGPPQTQRLWQNKSSLTKRRDTYDFIDPFRFKNKLRGKVVVMTLAHRGIGRGKINRFHFFPFPLSLDSGIKFQLSRWLLFGQYGTLSR
jgi:hypothetical protein